MKTLRIEKRDKVSKSDTKRVRKEGKIPVVIYGRGEEPMPATVSKKVLKSYLHEHKEEIIRLGPGRGKNVVIKEVQYDPITGEAIHIDFMHIHKGEKLKLSIPLILKGIPVGVTDGGVLEHLVREVEIECIPKNIPDKITIDVHNLKIGESIHTEDLSLGEEVKVLLHPGEALISVMAPRREEVKAETEGEEVTVEAKEVTEEKQEEKR